MTIWRTLTSNEDYNTAVKRIDAILDIERTVVEENELSLLEFLIEEYEAEHYPMPSASPLEVLKFMMEMKEIKQQDLIPILGTKGNVSKILSGKAKLQLDDIQPLSILLGIPMDTLIPKDNTHTKPAKVITNYVEDPVSDIMGAFKESVNPYRRHSRSKPSTAKKSRKKAKT